MTDSAQTETTQLKTWTDAGIVRVTGQDPREFLQGYLTSDAAVLLPGVIQPTAICNRLVLLE